MIKHLRILYSVKDNMSRCLLHDSHDFSQTKKKRKAETLRLMKVYIIF